MDLARSGSDNAMSYNIVVPADEKFVPGLEVFLKSFKYYHEGDPITVWLLSYGLQIDELFSLFEGIDVKIHKLDTSKPVPLQTKIESYRFAAELEGVTMLADADSFFCSSVLSWFRIAELGYIVASANGSNIYFGQEYEKALGIDLRGGTYNYKTICAPIIMDSGKYGDVYLDAVNYKMETGNGSIWMLMNIYMAKRDYLPKIITIPAQQISGIHHFMLKRDTRVLRVQGRLMTFDGLEVLMVHGKWWREDWINSLTKSMEGYCKNDIGCMKNTLASRQILKEEFDRWKDLK